jgi:hypothetical protein
MMTATMPRPETRRAAVLEALKRGEKLTHIDALRRGWGWRLAADIFALRLKGWAIVTDQLMRAKGSPIARYRLPAGSVKHDVPGG